MTPTTPANSSSTSHPDSPSASAFASPSAANLPSDSGDQQRFRREDLLRILRISTRQLAAWEKAELLHSAQHYSFVDLKQAKKIRDLCAQKLRPAVIRRSVTAMQRAVGMANPLLEAATDVEGSRLNFRHMGRTLEPETGQFRLDFDGLSATPGSGKPAMFARPEPVARPVQPTGPPQQSGASTDAASEASDLFVRGIALEEDPENHADAITCYQRVLELDPRHAAAHINLGTIHYNRQLFLEAEMHYRCAVEADPGYALAYFDLGNVLDETGRITEAIETYKAAVLLAPAYADAHYNLALAYEKIRLPRKALRHWRIYVKLDRVGPWATHARAQFRKILAADGLKIVRQELPKQ